MRKPKLEFPTSSDTNRPVQTQKKARSLKFQIYEVEELHYPCSENKGADQLCSYCTADLRLCFRQGKNLFKHSVIRSKKKHSDYYVLLDISVPNHNNIL